MENNKVWKEDLVPVDTARQWLMDNTDTLSVEGPLEVYRSNDWGMTALFKLVKKNVIQEVVLKIGFLPLFKTSPAIYQSLNKLASEHLSNFAKGEIKGNQTWLLFEKFKGEEVRSSKEFSLIKEMAVTMAEIQVEFIGLNSEDKQGIPVFEFQTSLKTTLHSFVNQAIEEFVPVWQAEATKIAEDFQLSLQDLKEIANPNHLKKMLANVDRILDELTLMKVPLSIYHLDFHTNNAVVMPNQQILLYDFEEAVITNPFFVLDKLLDEVSIFESEYSSDINYIDWSAAQLELRDAYLKPFYPTETINHLKTFDMSMVIAPLFYAYLSMSFLVQVGWYDAIPGLMAESFIKSCARIHCLSSRMS